ncbi:MAG: cyanophycin synthetase [Candidatus Andersenbacteria bacterium]|nr:cyanophycin synthetase [bacterium]MDZ4225790.1 cyanophycin synthetase [Candidatus Andersenbacteria bacterium]
MNDNEEIIDWLKNSKTVVMLGIGGVGMRALAAWLKANGKTVIGADVDWNFIKDDQRVEAYKLWPEDEIARHWQKAELVICSDAIPQQHPLRAVAVKEEKTVLSYAQALGAISRQYFTIAIAGTHGKSSTTALLANIFIDAGLDPTVIVGASVPGWPQGNARIGQGKYLIAEADEYMNHFLELAPRMIVLTSIDFDHPDWFNSVDDVADSMRKFTGLLPGGGKLIIGGDVWDKYGDKLGKRELATVVSWPQAHLDLQLTGEHMQRNAWLAITAAKEFTVAEDKARRAVEKFAGLGRRLETIGYWQGMEIISDYGHHPRELEATWQGFNEAHSYKKVLVVFEPHTAERLTSFFNDFVRVLADMSAGVLITPVYQARETSGQGKTSRDLYEKLRGVKKDVRLLKDWEKLPDTLKQLAGDYDILLAFTAGKLDQKLRKLK